MSNTKTTPQSDSNLDVTLTESANLISLDIQPVVFSGGGGSGTVTNIATGTGLTGGPITTTGTVSIDSTVATLTGAQELTNKTGLISQWTNDSAYLTSSALTPYYTSTQVDALPVSTFTNDAGYITSATTTTINNNANNRVITGSDTPDTLEGETGLTYDGAKMEVEGTAAGVNDPVLRLKTDNSGWNRPQLMAEDSNGKVFSQVGQLDTTAEYYQWNITLDPDNTHGRTGATTYAGDYFVSFEKNYTDQSAIRMDMKVFGANDGFVINVRDDFNSGGGNQYGHKPLIVDASELIFRNDNGDEYAFPQNDGTTGQAITTDGAGNLTFTTVSGGGGSSTLGGLSDVDLVGLADGDILRYNGTATEWQNTNLGLTLTPTVSMGSAFFAGADATATITNWASYDDPNIWAQVEDSGGNIIKTNAQLSAGMDLSAGTVTWNVGTTVATGYKIKIRVQDFGDLASDIAESTYEVENITVNATFRYYRLTEFSGFADTGSLPSSGNRVMVGTFRLWSATGGTGTQYPPNMTSDTAPSPNVALASRLFSGYDYYKAFDTNQNNTFWWNLGDTPAQGLAAWIQIDLGASYNVRSIQIAQGQNTYAFSGAKIYGSDTGSFTGEESLVLDATGLLSPWSSTSNFILG